MGNEAIREFDAFGRSVWLDNANVLVLGGRPFNREATRRIVGAWLRASFQGGRHARRVRKISRLESRFLDG